MSGRQTLSIDEIKDMLTARVDEVAYHYAQPSADAYEDKGQYWTLNPGRPDKRVGSFVIRLTGSNAGRWNDYATGQHGDLLDLIALSLNCSIGDALKEARAFLGLQVASPELVRKRQEEAARHKEQRQKAAEQAKFDKERAAKSAHNLWLASRQDLTGTPVDLYLQARGIDLAALPWPPRAIRYLADCYYQHTDPKTGEVIKTRRPAMLSIINHWNGGPVAVHRTYLELRGGTWQKADLPAPKKVMGDYYGAGIPIWKGIGPRGGKPGPLKDVGPGARVYIAEGIEDALSAALILPEARVLAAVSLSNLGGIELPPNVTQVTLIADRDDNQEARAALQRAIAQHQKAGRQVSLWQNSTGGKDLNDELVARARLNGGERCL